jgi:hypothetical protein
MNSTTTICYTQLPSMLFGYTHFSMNNLLSHIRTNVFSHTLLLLLCSLGPQKTHTIHTFGKPPMTPPWTCSPCPMEASKSSPPINGLFILQEPMRIENDLLSNWFYDENFWAQWNTKNIPSSNQIGWQSSWLMGLEDSSFPLSWIS